MDSAKPIYKYLMKQNSQIVDLITHGQTFHELNNLIKPIINQYIGNQWQIGNFSSGEITLTVNSAEQANRLRFQSANLLGEIKDLEGFKALNKINIKVGPGIEDERESQGKKPQKRHALMQSRTGQQHLKSLADSVGDPVLKASLLRLADHVHPLTAD